MSDLIYKGTSLQGISSHAQNVFYNNTDSELEATNVNAAIDEVNEKFDESVEFTSSDVTDISEAEWTDESKFESDTVPNLFGKLSKWVKNIRFLKSKVDTNTSAIANLSADEVAYDNTTSRLSAINTQGAIDEVSTNTNKALNKIQKITSLAAKQSFITSIESSRRYMVVCTGSHTAAMGVYLLSTTTTGAPTLAGVRPFDSGGSTISASTNQLTIYNGSIVYMNITLIDLL